MAHYLITGGSGFLGSHLIGELLALGHKITVIKRKTSSIARLKSYEGAIQIINSEDMTLQNTHTILQPIDAVFHLATNYGRNNETDKEIMYANYEWPLKLLQSSIQAQVKTFINFDTILPEEINSYAKSKKKFSQAAKKICLRETTSQFINIKSSHFYGPKDDCSRLVMYLASSLQNNFPEIMLSEGYQKIDFIYISDVVSGTLKILENLNNIDARFHEFILGTGNLTSIRELALLLKNKLNSKSKINFGAIPYRKNEQMAQELDLQEINKLGWSAKVNLSKGLDLVISELKNKLN